MYLFLLHNVRHIRRDNQEQRHSKSVATSPSVACQQGLYQAWFSIRRRRCGFWKHSHSYSGFHFLLSTPSEETIENTGWELSLYLMKIYFLHSTPFPVKWNFWACQSLTCYFKNSIQFYSCWSFILTVLLFLLLAFFPHYLCKVSLPSDTHLLALPFEDNPSLPSRITPLPPWAMFGACWFPAAWTAETTIPATATLSLPTAIHP